MTIVLNTFEEGAVSELIRPLIKGDVEVINTSGMKIAHCMGCNQCWLKTPGVCAIKDDYEARKFTGPEKNPWFVHLLFRLFIKRLVRKNFEHFAQQWGCTRPLDDKPYLRLEIKR